MEIFSEEFKKNIDEMAESLENAVNSIMSLGSS